MIARRISPAMVVAAAALFVALGGSALGVRSQGARLGCTTGAAKAYVTIDVDHFAGSFPQSFSSDAKLFSRRYSCNGRAPEARTVGGVVQVRFPGLARGAPVVSALTNAGGTASVSVTPEGIYRVATLDPSGNTVSRGFTLVVF